MKFSIKRSQIIKSLQQVSGALGGRSALPILSHLLIEVKDESLWITGTDLEVELICKLDLEGDFEVGRITVPSRKFLDIFRGLPDDALAQVEFTGERVIIHSGRSRFTLSTLPANDFPNIEDWQSDITLNLTQKQLRQLIEKTQFSMANQDVRYFLNGMLFEIDDNTLRTVATDGHRMAVAKTSLDQSYEMKQVIVPRKGVLELIKLLDQPEAMTSLQIGQSNIRAQVNQFIFTSKLVDGRFPDYRRVIPENTTKTLEASCDELRQSFSRVAILSNEKFRGVRVNLSGNQMRISANNPEQEEAEESLDVNYQGDPLEIGFNVGYVLDILNTLKCETVHISMSDANASTLVENIDDQNAQYVVMPIRL